jgi:hypothetical protein
VRSEGAGGGFDQVEGAKRLTWGALNFSIKGWERSNRIRLTTRCLGSRRAEGRYRNQRQRATGHH